jgi:hypothetical protein
MAHFCGAACKQIPRRRRSKMTVFEIGSSDEVSSPQLFLDVVLEIIILRNLIETTKV